MIARVATFRVYPLVVGFTRMECDLIACFLLMSLSLIEMVICAAAVSLIGGHDGDAPACRSLLISVFACWLMEAEEIHGVCFCRLAVSWLYVSWAHISKLSLGSCLLFFFVVLAGWLLEAGKLFCRLL